jgi:Arc/MetJ-type ribon-helix-helix transcriptional regulator
MNSRIGIRVTPNERKDIEVAVKEGKAKDISDLIRKALKEFLEKR